MKLGNWRVKNIWFKPDERERATRLVKSNLRKGWEFVDGGIDDDNLVHGDLCPRYTGYETVQIQHVDGHNDI